MANQVLAFSNRALFYGNLGPHSLRKRLIWIRRDFDPEDQGNLQPVPLITPGHAFLTAAQYVTNGNAIPNADPQLAWVGFNAQYLTNRRLTQMTNPIQARHRFSVIISSLPYLNHETPPNGRTTLQINYLRNHHRKQGGCHLFVSRQGTVMTAVTYFNDQADDLNEPYRVLPSVAPMTSIYPVMRIPYTNQNIQLTQPQLALGLYYNTFEENLGDRYYHRFGDQCLQAGNVHEVLHQVIQAQNAVPFLNALIGEDQPYVAFYVCTGAKLVVYDQYTGVNDQSHNRSLVQQGGIVLFRGDIRICLARTGTEIDADRNTIGLILLSWDDFIWHHMYPVDPNTPLPGINQNQKVIFLGAQDGHFNSIAWQLEVMTHNGERVISLMTPHDARFEAITNGPDGIIEMWSRIYYELLHDSVLTQHQTIFVKPAVDMALQILNPNQSRSYTVRYEQDYIDRMDVHPREFNLVYPSGEHANHEYIEEFIEGQNFRLAPPPMYPPQFQRTEFGDLNYKINYWPSKQIQNEDIDYECYRPIKDNNGLIKGWYSRMYNFPGGPSNYTIDEYGVAFGNQFTRVEIEKYNDPIKLNGQQWWGDYYRLGVDGWVYWSTNRLTFIENTTVYAFHSFISQPMTYQDH